MNALLLSLALVAASAPSAAPPSGTSADSQAVRWDADPIWHDGLVEKATYDASRVIYGRPRPFEATFLTNKEQHETATWTKATQDSNETVEVWKHNQIEVIPTPNYDYKYTTTSHLTTEGLQLTRLDMSESEWCGTTYAQYLKAGEDAAGRAWDYFTFSYMPGSGRETATVEAEGDADVVPINALPLYLRGFDFERGGSVAVKLLPDQKGNKLTPHEPMDGELRYVGPEGDGHRIEVYAGGELFGTYVMGSRPQLHVMRSFESADGTQTYALKEQDRVNYWTIQGE